MTFTVSITSQGQMSIPASIRRKLNLDSGKKALVTEESGHIIVKPLKDILELKGSLTSKYKPSPAQIREGFEQWLAEGSTIKSE